MLILSSTDRFALRAKRGSHPSKLNRGVSDHECPLHRSWLTALEQPDCLRRSKADGWVPRAWTHQHRSAAGPTALSAADMSTAECRHRSALVLVTLAQVRPAPWL